MTWVAVIRPDEWNLPLLVHVFGAIVLVGGVLTAATALVYGRGNVSVLRTGYFSLLAVALPGWIVMRVGAGWIYSEEGWDDVESEPAWLGIGWLTSELGGLLLLISLILGGIGVRRLRSGGGTGLLKATLVISLILLAAYIVSIWAMSAKPG